MKLANPSRLLFWMFLLAGCVQPPVPLTAEQAHQAETERLCWGYHEYALLYGDAARVSMTNIRVELTARGAMSDYDWSVVDKQKIANGINHCAVLAFFGIPSLANENGQIEVLAFPSNAYITLVSGKVTAYQVPAQYMLR